MVKKVEYWEADDGSKHSSKKAALEYERQRLVHESIVGEKIEAMRLYVPHGTGIHRLEIILSNGCRFYADALGDDATVLDTKLLDTDGIEHEFH
jgi:hypothetical protein